VRAGRRTVSGGAKRSAHMRSSDAASAEGTRGRRTGAPLSVVGSAAGAARALPLASCDAAGVGVPALSARSSIVRSITGGGRASCAAFSASTARARRSARTAVSGRSFLRAGGPSRARSRSWDAESVDAFESVDVRPERDWDARGSGRRVWDDDGAIGLGCAGSVGGGSSAGSASVTCPRALAQPAVGCRAGRRR
jgi:hypothetical protein